MERIELIYKTIEDQETWKKSPILDALVACLTPDEACRVVDVDSPYELVLRNSLRRKIARDISAYGCLPCHTELTERLVSRFPALPHSLKQSCGSWISYLYDYLPFEHRLTILDFLLTSRYGWMRQRAYKILFRNWIPQVERLLLQAWEKHKDELGAQVIVEHLPAEFLFQQFVDLEKALSRNNRIARLFIKVGAMHPDVLGRLAEADGITFAYVSVKLKRVLSNDEASEIFEQYKLDERVGLLIWCFGQMGLWDVLKSITEHRKEFADLYLAKMKEEFSQRRRADLP